MLLFLLSLSPVHALSKHPGILCVHMCVWTIKRKDLKITFWKLLWPLAVGQRLIGFWSLDPGLRT
jgi:hypothetical protein